MGRAAAGCSLTALDAPTPGRRGEGALACLHARDAGRW